MINTRYTKKSIEELLAEEIKQICRDNLFLAFGNTMSHYKVHVEERIVERKYNEHRKFLNMLYNIIFNPVHDKPICDISIWYNKEINKCVITIDNVNNICKTKQVAKLIDAELSIETDITIKTNLYNLEDLNFIDKSKII